MATGLISGSAHTGLATGNISGYATGLINFGSGVYNFNHYQLTGVPTILSFTGFTGSGLHSITPFTGYINSTITGSGFNSQYITSGISGIINPILYQRTFTGAWNLLTGNNLSGLFDFQQNGYDNYTGYYNPSGPLNYAGNSVFVRVNYIPYQDSLVDIALLTITGLNSGIQIYITGQST